MWFNINNQALLPHGTDWKNVPQMSVVVVRIRNHVHCRRFFFFFLADGKEAVLFLLLSAE